MRAMLPRGIFSEALGMTLASRRTTTLVAILVLVVLTGTLTLLLIARPTHRNAHTAAVDLAQQRYLSPMAVRRAFAKYGVKLAYTTPATPGLWLSRRKPPLPATDLYVMIAGRTGTVDWGEAAQSRDDTLIGNLDVHYGGSSRRLAREIQGATELLRKQS